MRPGSARHRGAPLDNAQRDNAATSDAPPARTLNAPLAVGAELGGDLPCVRCGYNLKGLTVKGMCPECGTSVRTTLLAVVDPMASELRAITFPRATANGMVLWAFAGFFACIFLWILQIVTTAGAPATSQFIGEAAIIWLKRGLIACVIISGVGAIAFVRPHEGIPWRQRAMALMAVGAYIPLFITVRYLYTRVNARLGVQLGRDDEIARTMIRLAQSGSILIILMGLRPAARQLQGRWLLMRIGAVARQTMLAMAAVVVVWTIGDGLVLLSWTLHGGSNELVWMIGRFFILGGSLLFTVGMLSIAMDVWRVHAVVAQRPFDLGQLLAHPRGTVYADARDSGTPPARRASP